jgi:Fe-S cluster biogenesis protein NfuA
MFIQTEATPNPATLKFLPGRVVLDGSPREFRSIEEAGESPLASALFAIPGVTGVFFGYDFVTVTKADSEWPHLKPAVLGAIMEHFVSGRPILIEGNTAEVSEEDFDPADQDTVDTIKELLETRIRPAVAADGGDITFRSFRSGVVYLNMRGSCAGCPSSTATLRHGIQNLLKHFLPEVEEVRAVA